MLTRRDVMTGSLLGAIATGAPAAPDEQAGSAEVERGLTAIKDELERIREVLDAGLVGPSFDRSA
jgi:hypothetical protein